MVQPMIVNYYRPRGPVGGAPRDDGISGVRDMARRVEELCAAQERKDRERAEREVEREVERERRRQRQREGRRSWWLPACFRCP